MPLRLIGRENNEKAIKREKRINKNSYEIYSN